MQILPGKSDQVPDWWRHLYKGGKAQDSVHSRFAFIVIAQIVTT
jgi:hypothetical protein